MFTQNHYAFASVNGQISEVSNASVSIRDRGILFGHGVFETLLVKNQNIHQWSDHYQRLVLGCKKIKISVPDETQLKNNSNHLIQHIYKITQSNILRLKIIVTGGDYENLSIPSQIHQSITPNIYILCETTTLPSIEQRLKGLKVKSVLDRRSQFLKEIKSINYLDNFVSLTNAQEKGFDDALFKDQKGFWTEGVTSSFFWFDKDKTIFFTPPKGNCLAGTSVLKLTSELKNRGLPFSFQKLHKNEATKSKGCAFISSIRGLMPISQIDDITFDISSNEEFYKDLIEMFEL